MKKRKDAKQVAKATTTAVAGPPTTTEAVVKKCQAVVKKAEAKKKAKKMSALAAAAELLAAAGKPMHTKVLVESMLAKKMWTTKGKTPAATLYAAIIREIAKKGKAARFKMTGPANFAFNTGAKSAKA